MTVPLPASSAIPGALTQFMAVAEGALPSGTTVWWGKELGTYSTPLTLQITEIVGDQEPAELGPQFRREEKFSLVCTLSAYQGGPVDQANAACLTEVMNNFALIHSAVANNPTLNQAVRFAQVGNFAINPDTDANGVTAVSLDFQLRCEQRIRSLDAV